METKMVRTPEGTSKMGMKHRKSGYVAGPAINKDLVGVNF